MFQAFDIGVLTSRAVLAIRLSFLILIVAGKALFWLGIPTGALITLLACMNGIIGVLIVTRLRCATSLILLD